ncbi:MAG: long-chain fatty acid--CoA ligase, partial [Bacteroidota bacterium]
SCKRNNTWQKFSGAQYSLFAERIAAGLLSLGLQRGDKVATVFTNNRPEWNFIDMGIQLAGMIHVPIYPTISDDDHAYILKHAEVKVVFTSDLSALKKMQPLAERNDTIKKLYTVNEISDAENWNELLKLGRENAEKFSGTLESIRKECDPSEVATIIYTSGTTGQPKGVMLTHENIVSNMLAARHIHNYGKGNRCLSFLPLCHVFERTINYHFQLMGISIYYAENMGTISDNLKEVKPHLFISVPRLLESVYDKIIMKGRDLGGFKKMIFFWAVSMGMKFNFNRENGWWYHFRLGIADKLVFSKWRDALGGNAGLIVVGGAALQPRLARIFSAAGIITLEGYGLTETSPVVAANNQKSGEIMVGTVGPLFENVQVKISEEGEILVKGPNVMKGYYKDEKMTAEVIDNDGWLHTGDIGLLVDGKYLKITDRKKEIFKNSAGKYIAPQPIENMLKESFFIEQAMVVGEDEKFASALISPNFRYLHDWCAERKIKYRDNKELVRIDEVNRQYQEEINQCNKQLGQVEQIKRFRLVCEEWTPQSGELSPTLKLKRNVIYKKYDHILREIYKYAPDEVNRADKTNRE